MEYKAPKELSEMSKAVWRGVVPRRAKTVERMLLVKTALLALDRAQEVTAEIKKEGLTIENPSSGAKRANPLIKLEKELRAQFATIWDGMNLDWDGVIDGENPPSYGPGCGSQEKQEREQREYNEDVALNEAAVKEFLGE